MTTNKPKLLFVIPDELLKRIDDFRFKNCINFRSEAVRRLLEEALAKYDKKAKSNHQREKGK